MAQASALLRVEKEGSGFTRKQTLCVSAKGANNGHPTTRFELYLESTHVIRPAAIRTSPPPNAAVSTLFAHPRPHALRSTAIQAEIDGIFPHLSSEIESLARPTEFERSPDY